MAPVRSKKQITEQALTSPRKLAMAETVPLRAGSPSAYPRSPIKRRTPGTITMQQKQAMIDNMQLEITERARRLRAQYSFMATTVRSRVEMRINRIPMSMRHVKMGDLLQKFLEQEQQRATRSAALRKAVVARTSPQKQLHSTAHAARAMTRTKKRMSDAISGDKENEIEHNENAKKRVRGAPNPDIAHVRPAQILSPTSSNSRLANRSRPASPVKSGIARPASPLKNSGTSRSATATSMLSSMVEKAKATRAGVARKVTTASTASTSSTSTTAATRTRRAAATTASRAPASRPTTRTARRSLATSESSEASSGTVVRKGAASRGAAAKKTAASSVRKGTTTTTKKTAAKSTATTGTGRVLRKRA
ncbi:hypothetical protein BHE90_008147 [Fusarium euwallaceae]|uniref:Borealin N-terminal domain-containing protein n=5 Tax=Fusarium solani species complex TaxID=232080 RepID=A0A3M2S149_9HYPO|nr:hypothetical protein CDV36_009069 [Fusarium kuroshium]RSL69529.1 hypothetical protein CEP51_012335 [Fusarium floridanum]RSM03978.1 hypothetical protein CDV31_010241 [Fusarium ambrosium]RTE77382.1 hypothetical protein BHE90_008147 [Fusarium euwallaceae]